MRKERYVAYVGTYTHGSSLGIHIFDIDTEKWNMTERKVIPINNPSDVIVSSNGKYLYSIADQGVQSFKILPDGDLEPMNTADIGGMRGCYLEVDAKDRFLFVAGYHDGRISMLPLHEDGTIGDVADGIFHKGIGINTRNRRSVPHVTCVQMTPDQGSVCAVDSGLDQVKIYKIDYINGKLRLEDILRGELDSSPRMIRIDNQRKFAYVLYEMDSDIHVYRVTKQKGGKEVFDFVQSISTVEEREHEQAAASGIEFSPDGKHLFVSNAGVNTVSVYDVDKKTGMLTKICENEISGDYPKMLIVMPDNEHFAVLNNESNEICIFKMDYEKKYFLMDTKPIKIEQPNCISIHKLEN